MCAYAQVVCRRPFCDIKVLYLVVSYDRILCFTKSTLSLESALFDFRRSVNSKDLANFIGAHYKAPQMVLSAAGGKYYSTCVLMEYLDV